MSRYTDPCKKCVYRDTPPKPSTLAEYQYDNFMYWILYRRQKERPSENHGRPEQQ